MNSGGKFTIWFDQIDAAKTEMLAIAIAAITSGLRVVVLLESIQENSTIDRLTLIGE